MNIKQILNWISKLNCGEAPVWSFPHANKGTSRQEEEQLLGLGVRIMMLDANFNKMTAERTTVFWVPCCDVRYEFRI
jgi:hypothetical protein